MKHLIIIFFLFITATSFAANKKVNPFKEKGRISKTNKPKAKKLTTQIAEKSACRVCCTVTVYNHTGMGATVEVCAGWLLTSCQTAGTRACDRAYEAAEEMLNPGG